MTSPLRFGRRAVLKLGMATGLGSLLGLPPAQAEDSQSGPPPTGGNENAAPRTDPVPLIDARFPCEIAEDVWIIPDRRIFLVPNVGIVIGKKAALVIDCGLGPQCGQKVLEAADRIAPGRKLILTHTHAHPEHAFGAVAFKDRAKIFLNRQQNDYLVKTGPALLKLFRERFREEERELLAGTEILPATETYDGDSGTLDLGGRRVEFHAVGTAHSPGDQIISLPKEKILFSGDLIEERMFPIVPFLPPTMPKRDIDVANWVQALSNIEQSGSSIIVPGHGSLGQAEIARSLLVYFADLQARVKRLSGTESIEALISELKPEIRTTYSTWQYDRFIEPAIRYFAQA